ncbi:MAG: flagella basal body P-ring formation protein FlgA [Lentisphaerae bacterium RIFOXYB12_FULL_65_16]|nr:MAG: flagella basal body P-ring formation protein FlgA [Lentisphaerae bacterium RIFOXYA12_64_32]OGV92056.1 MAG: flagella basal body P-ring formation protein FlgA [Lentisphaerae bacterium RIFOXYB12_FULL_65_16]
MHSAVDMLLRKRRDTARRRNRVASSTRMRHLLRLLSCAAFLGVSGTWTSGANANEDVRVLQVRDCVTARASKVTLGELVVNSTVLDPVETALEILDAPPLGGQTRLTLVELAFLLQRHPPLLDLQLRGPDAIVVDRSLPAGDAQKLKNKLVDAIRQVPPWASWKIDVLLQGEDERKLAGCDASLNLEVHPLDGGLLSGSVPLRVAFVNAQGTRVSEVMLSPVILREVQVVIVTNSLDRGHVLRNEDVQLAPLWVGDQNRTVLSQLGDCVGRELSRRMTAGEIVQPGYLLNPVCARRGDVVWIRCASGALSVSIATNALEVGRLGEQVQVRNPVSGKSFEARLVAERQAELDLGQAPVR